MSVYRVYIPEEAAFVIFRDVSGSIIGEAETGYQGLKDRAVNGDTVNVHMSQVASILLYDKNYNALDTHASYEQHGNVITINGARIPETETETETEPETETETAGETETAEILRTDEICSVIRITGREISGTIALEIGILIAFVLVVILKEFRP